MRIVGMCVARVQHDGGYLLRKNRSGVFVPVAGAFNAQGGGRQYLITHCGATEFEKGPGKPLRFRVPDTSVDAVIAWYKRRQMRETTIRRTLMERLADEQSIFTRGELRRGGGVRDTFAGYTRHDGLTQRSGVSERQTAYLVEVFDVTFPPLLLDKLMSASSSAITFATPVQIQNGTFFGTKIDPVAQTLLV
jgi:hypothetical protein